MPESFRVLIKELQSLGLDMRVLDDAGNEIDLKQNFDDEDGLVDARDMKPGEDVLVEDDLDGFSPEEPEGGEFDADRDEAMDEDDFGLSDDFLGSDLLDD